MRNKRKLANSQEKEVIYQPQDDLMSDCRALDLDEFDQEETQLLQPEKDIESQSLCASEYNFRNLVVRESYMDREFDKEEIQKVNQTLISSNVGLFNSQSELTPSTA
jgi:hypothetical protein